MLHEALERMPHRGVMRLIDRIEVVEEGAIRCIARDHTGADYPLRLDGVLHCTALVELGAQAAAVHASLSGVGAAHVGLVLALRDVDVRRPVIDHAGPLAVRAEHLATMDGASTYRFEVDAGDETVLSGTALLSIRAAPR